MESIVKNTNIEHKDSLSFHERIALRITRFVGSMACAYLFCMLALISLPAAIASDNILVIDTWVAQTFLQLVLLSIIMVGQNQQQRHSELRAENDFAVDLKNEQSLQEVHRKLDILVQEKHEDTTPNS